MRGHPHFSPAISKMSVPIEQESFASSSPLWIEESWEKSKYSTLSQPPPLGIVALHKESVCTKVKKKARRSCSILKNACVTRYIICSAVNCDCRSIYHNYFFWSKSTILILLMNALYSTALCGVTAPLLEVIFGSQYTVAQMVVLYGTSQLLFPIAGHVADACIGRHAVLRFSIWCSWIAFALIVMMVSLDSYDNHINSINRYMVLPLASLMLSVSYMCFMANIIPFGLDQLQGAPRIHYSSFLYWWYWTVKLGGGIAVIIPLNCFNLIEISILVKAGVGLLCITCALLLDAMFKTCLVLEPCCSNQENPLRQIAKVISYITNMPAYQYVPSSVRHEIDFTNYSRLDLAKKRYGGKYETEQVEDVRTFFSILLILISVGTIILSSAMMSGVLSLLEARKLEYQLFIYEGLCNIDVSSLSVLYIGLTLVLLPLLDLLIVPMLRHLMCHPSILKCVGIGGALTVLSATSMFALQGVLDRSSTDTEEQCIFADSEASVETSGDISIYWIFLPVIVQAISQVMLYVPSYEFICAQSPYHMRGLLLGLFFAVQGLFSLLAAIIQFIFSAKPNLTYSFYSCSFWYYLIVLVLGALGLCLFVIVAFKYKKRKRDDIFHQVGMIEEYYSSGRIHSSHWI